MREFLSGFKFVHCARTYCGARGPASHITALLCAWVCMLAGLLQDLFRLPAPAALVEHSGLPLHLRFNWAAEELCESASLRVVRALDASHATLGASLSARPKKHIMAAIREHLDLESSPVAGKLSARRVAVDLSHQLHSVFARVVECLVSSSPPQHLDVLAAFVGEEAATKANLASGCPPAPTPTPWQVVIALWRALDCVVAYGNLGIMHMAVCVDSWTPEFKRASAQSVRYVGAGMLCMALQALVPTPCALWCNCAVHAVPCPTHSPPPPPSTTP